MSQRERTPLGKNKAGLEMWHNGYHGKFEVVDSTGCSWFFNWFPHALNFYQEDMPRGYEMNDGNCSLAGVVGVDLETGMYRTVFHLHRGSSHLEPYTHTKKVVFFTEEQDAEFKRLSAESDEIFDQWRATVRKADQMYAHGTAKRMDANEYAKQIFKAAAASEVVP